LFVHFMSWLKLFAALILGLGVSGCAGVGGAVEGKSSLSQTPEQLVMLRAQARWDALLSGEINQAYGYISPAGRLGMPVTEYRLRVNMQYAKKAKVTGAKCEPELCEVSLNYDYVLNGLALSQVITEKWILDSGEWWLVYRG
jgi:hypothetical protein